MSEQNLTKSERRRLKKEKRMQEREAMIAKVKKKNRIKSVRNYSIIAVIILVIAAYVYIKTVPPENAPIISVSPASVDFGIVSQAKGAVTMSIDVYNDGNEDLVIKSLPTSCSCTSASIIYNEVKGPKFGMASHGTNPKDWSVAIPPGDSAKLQISYDPNVHKDLRGPVIRSVFIESNDPIHSSKEVRVNVVQTD